MSIKDFKIGDKVFIVRSVCYPTKHIDTFEGIIISIGKKYIKVESKNEFNGVPTSCFYTFSKAIDYEDMFLNKEDTSISMFKDNQGYADYKEYLELRKWFYSLITSSTRLNLDQFKRIKAIIEEIKE